MLSHCDFSCEAHTYVFGSSTNHTDKITMPLHHPKGSSVNPKAINRNKASLLDVDAMRNVFLGFISLKRMAALPGRVMI